MPRVRHQHPVQVVFRDAWTHHTGSPDLGGLSTSSHLPVAGLTSAPSKTVFGISIIASICLERWQIALLFCTLKQQFQIKTFIRTRPNVVHTQLWRDLIAALVFQCLQFRSHCQWTSCPTCRLSCPGTSSAIATSESDSIGPSTHGPILRINWS